MNDIGRYIGVSTHFMPLTYNETLEQAISIVVKAGIRTFELVPVKYQAQIGWPYNIPNVGVWVREMSNKDIKKLEDLLSMFDLVTIHSPHLDLNIASCNIGIREESIRQYMECLELARKLDVEIVTFHPGRQTSGFIRSDDEILEYEILFARKAVDYAKSHGMKVGYETGSVRRLKRLFEHFKPSEFGVNIDIGHVIMGGYDPVELIELWKDRTIEFHFHGVNHYWGGYMDHQPVWMNNAVDFRKVISKMRDVGFMGPIICEIQGNDIEQHVEHVLEARELIEFLWLRDSEIDKEIRPWRLLKVIREKRKHQ
ncbi:MAG: hypothetical protein DRJ51_03350 [Thermoprotei archaeon]|nr:MAG: hypothetical protein DRJ51_03350 [Thermoprotei archaeon]RLF03409.1 MAG: hypothetical protein DRJ59_00715 [Thermoprotei archaeon]